MDLLEGIYSRRSIRQYTKETVSDKQITEIITSGTWAPSGLNNQPWRFVIIKDENKRRELAGLTKYRRIIEEAPVSIAVFIDREAMYNDVKDHQAMGACIQNMLLAAHALGLGAVWLGEILNRAEDARNVLGLDKRYELMAVVAVGNPGGGRQKSSRKSIDEVILKEYP